MTHCGSSYGYRIHVVEGTEKCQPCRAAHSRAGNRWRARAADGPLLVDATGTNRRLRALMAIGWTFDAMAAELFVDRAVVQRWASRARVHRDTAARVAQLYQRVADTPGSSKRARAIAARSGWPAPIAWDDDTIDDPKTRPHAGQRTPLDEVAVARAASGRHGDRPAHLTRAEKRAAVVQLTQRGDSAADIAAALGITSRTVQFYRSTERVPA